MSDADTAPPKVIGYVISKPGSKKVVACVVDKAPGKPPPRAEEEDPRITGYVVSKPDSHKVLAYVIEDRPPPLPRQARAMRNYVTVFILIIAVILVMGLTDVTLHGFSFFVFRSGGTGQSPSNAPGENQGPGQPDQPVTLVATTPNGGKLLVSTTLAAEPGLAWAGVAEKKPGKWLILAQGRTSQSVALRTAAVWNKDQKGYETKWYVVPLRGKA